MNIASTSNADRIVLSNTALSAAAAPAPSLVAAPVDQYEGPRSKLLDETVADAKAHLRDAAADAGRFALWPLDAAMKTAELLGYYAGLLKGTVTELSKAAQDLLGAAEKTAGERK